MIDDAPVSRSVDCHVPGHGRGATELVPRLTVAGRGHGGNSIARTDDRTNNERLSRDDDLAALDIATNTHRDATPGDDTASNVHTDPALSAGIGARSRLHPAHAHAEQDAGADLDAISDHGALSGKLPDWGLPSFLLGD